MISTLGISDVGLQRSLLLETILPFSVLNIKKTVQNYVLMESH